MYTLGPDKEIPAKTTNKGSIFTTVGWILSTEIFAFYVEKFAKYDLFYGSMIRYTYPITKEDDSNGTV